MLGNSAAKCSIKIQGRGTCPKRIQRRRTLVGLKEGGKIGSVREAGSRGMLERNPEDHGGGWKPEETQAGRNKANFFAAGSKDY
ncbi:hypothetical protein WN48_09520 [Eufriesea mexicana]|nr:hypothetical protein WN48_09520 [Eufriesea mexicana]